MSAPTKSESVQYNDTDIIFEQGDIGLRAYKIISGSVAVLIGYGPIALRKQVTLLLPGQSFGSVALHSPTSQRTATCIARGTTTLQITSTSNTISNVPRVPTLLSMFQKKPLASITQKTAVSVDAEAATVDAEAASINTQQVTYSKGEFIVREGDQNADSWFVITKGCVDVNVKTEKVGSMTEGEVFGESAILRQDKTRTASVVARDGVLGKICLSDII
jgi:CRP-like cAMP-binding protein